MPQDSVARSGGRPKRKSRSSGGRMRLCTQSHESRLDTMHKGDVAHPEARVSTEITIYRRASSTLYRGELKIAEVTSRFTDVHQFATIIGDLGFKLISKVGLPLDKTRPLNLTTLGHQDESNTHFTLFEFRKVARPPLGDRKWDDLRGKHGVLKPCEYKRR